MKILNSCICACLFLLGCANNVSFSRRDSIIAMPFTKMDTVIYTSAKGQIDTVIFYPVKKDTVRYRDFEQGFYDLYILRIPYNITLGSYHKLLVKMHPTDSTYLFDCNLSTSYTLKQFCFIGLYFDATVLDTLSIDTTSTILFDKKNAQGYHLNVNKGINSFKFSPKCGIVSFVDDSGVIWVGKQLHD